MVEIVLPILSLRKIPAKPLLHPHAYISWPICWVVLKKTCAKKTQKHFPEKFWASMVPVISSIEILKIRVHVTLSVLFYNSVSCLMLKAAMLPGLKRQNIWSPSLSFWEMIAANKYVMKHVSKSIMSTFTFQTTLNRYSIFYCCSVF